MITCAAGATTSQAPSTKTTKRTTGAATAAKPGGILRDQIMHCDCSSFCHILMLINEGCKIIKSSAKCSTDGCFSSYLPPEIMAYCCCDMAEWVKILQYKSKYTPTATGAGDLSKSIADSNFAKLSDVAINAMAADGNGYHYFKLEDAGDDKQPTLLVRTTAPFSDFARNFGWTRNYHVCKTAAVHDCVWEKPKTYQDYFDSSDLFGDNCTSWVVDQTSNPGCFDPRATIGITSLQRCFSKGKGCSNPARDDVTIYKWSFGMVTTVESITTTDASTTAITGACFKSVGIAWMSMLSCV